MRCPIVDAERTGATLKSKRKENGLSVTKVATALYVDERSVYAWERGERLPSVNTMLILSTLYGCTIDDLIVRA